ncbi:MAG: ATP-binding protein, partial [Chloroflexi bacterium]|nr:ATP-binding protein [Chloroflexota bacterium]
MQISDTELEQLVRNGESFRVEFKETLEGSAPTAIREAVCAFANDLPGSGEAGVVFVGVRDNGEPVGIDITDRMLTQLSDIKTDGNIVPPASMLVEKRTLLGTNMAVITVVPSD